MHKWGKETEAFDTFYFLDKGGVVERCGRKQPWAIVDEFRRGFRPFRLPRASQTHMAVPLDQVKRHSRWQNPSISGPTIKRR